MRRFAENVKWDSPPGIGLRSLPLFWELIAVTRFGTELFCTFLDHAWPSQPDEVLEPLNWSDVTKLFFENAASIKRQGEMFEPLWKSTAVKELDAALRAVAETGEFVLVPVTLSPAGMAELWRRWQYAIIGAELEDKFGSPLNISVPRDAPPELKGAALALYVLGGPARAYRKDLVMKDRLRRHKQGLQLVRKALGAGMRKQR